jgi:hypothetical protein
MSVPRSSKWAARDSVPPRMRCRSSGRAASARREPAYRIRLTSERSRVGESDGVRRADIMRSWHGGACLLAFLAIVLASPVGARLRSAAEPELRAAAGWSRFDAPALGMSVDYPADLFSVREGAPEQGGGQRFRTADGRARLSVYVLANEDRATPAMYLKEHLRIRRGALSYRRVSRRFFAISGVHDGRIYYSRCNFDRGRNSRMHCIYIVYPQREARAWDYIVTRISRSLRASDASR